MFGSREDCRELFGDYSPLVIRKEQIMEKEAVEIVELTVEELEERTAPGIVICT